MEETQLIQPENQTRQSSRISSLKYFLIGIWILFLYLLCLSAVSFSLSTFQFKQRLAEVKVEVDDTTASSDDIFVTKKCDISNVIGVEEFISPIVEIPCVRHIEQEKIHYSGFDLLSNYESLQNEFEVKIKEQKALLTTAEENLDNADSDFEKKIAQANIETATHNIAELKNQKTKQESLYKELNSIVRDGQFYNSLYSLIVINKQSGDITKANFWAIPDALLSILLMLSMGGLGSLITVTIEYIRHGNQRNDINLAEFIFRPLLGSIMALAVYIAFRSGQITISGDSSNPFSPFLLSFIGIVSGMISEHVYNRFVKYGEKIISHPSD